MDRTNPTMIELAYRLLAHEASNGESSELRIPAAVSVSEKLRQPISMLAGTAGFRALLARSLSLARAQAPALAAVQVKPDGALDWKKHHLSELHHGEAAHALVAQLLSLLSNFIGEALTLRLLHDVWPDLTTIEIDPRGKTK